MKASAAASGGRGKQPPPNEHPITPSITPPASLLQFGDTLFKAYTQQPEHASSRLPLTRYADYLHHFGFSMEREGRSRQVPSTTAAAAAAGTGLSKPSMESRAGASTATATAGGHLINHTSSDDASFVVDTAEWGISEDIKSEADQRCSSVGPLPGVSDRTAVATQLCTPFSSPTWRQTSTQCALKKARCVYAWLCAHVSLHLHPSSDITAEAEAAALAAGAQKSQRNAPASKKAGRPTKKEKEASTVQEPAGPVDPLTQALDARRGTPLLLAELYAAMLGAVSVKCEVVSGQLKGLAPGEAFEWAWNIVRIDGRAYLVDVAAALSDGVLRSASTTSTAQASADAAKTSNAASTSPSAGGGAAARRGSVEETDKELAGWGAHVLLSTTPAAMRRDFFFFTHPGPFLSSHLPNTAAQSLLLVPTKAVHWVMQPCVTPALYRYGLQLVSHPSHATLSIGSTPSHISVTNTAPGKAELCCVLFPGTLQNFFEDVTRNTALSPDWVWHQREDATDVETFTLTVPQAGYYVAVIGVRDIRADPYSAAIVVSAAAAAFCPVVFYEVRVGFTSSSVPVLPRQYLSPCICRLMSPLCSQIAPGSQKFSVMPTCSNVLAVAVVRNAGVPSSSPSVSSATAALAGPAGAAAGGGGASPATARPPPTRSVISFLRFEAKRAAFEGFASVKAGDVVEVWVLYGAPDHNGQQLTQRVAAMKTAVAEPPAAADVKAADKKKKKTVTGEQLQVSEAHTSRLEHALSRGELFQLFVGNIEVKHFVSPAVMSVIMPQPTVEQEQASTLRRLAGVTDALLSEADHTTQYQATPVGSYFGAIATNTR